MKKATFSDLQIEWIEPIRKNGNRKPVYSTIEIEDTLHPVTIKFNFTVKELYVRGKDLNSDRMERLYTETGEVASGIWQHGRYGSNMHEEALQFVPASNKLVTVTSYQNGRIKDSYKYLKSI